LEIKRLKVKGKNLIRNPEEEWRRQQKRKLGKEQDKQDHEERT